jgi:multiple sugar transport system ATP-binding protein
MGDVEYDNITKKYGEETAVEDMNIHIQDGEFVTLVGPSGCGKSTTLETVAGLTDPTSGSIYIDGEDVTDLPPKDRDIAMVFQNIALFPHMDVYDNISYGLRLRDVDKDEVDRRVDEAARMVQMEGMLDRMPDEMSGGQQQRVAIARAIIRDPGVFLMDEPLANLDAKLRVHMRTQLQQLHQELDATIIYVTHNQEEAMTMSNRIAVMNEGELQQFAAPLECYYRPTNQFVAGFIGSPSMNFIDGQLTSEGVETEHFSLEIDRDLPETSEGQAVTVGVRPEDITIAEEATFETESGPVGADDASDMDGTPSESIPVETQVLEPVGDDIYVYTTFEGSDAGTPGRSGGETAAADGGTAETEADPTDATGELLMSIPPMPDMDTYEATDQRTEVVVDREMVHLFDAETGEAITHGLTPDAEVAEPTDAAGGDADDRHRDATDRNEAGDQHRDATDQNEADDKRRDGDDNSFGEGNADEWSVTDEDDSDFDGDDDGNQRR